MAEGIFTGRTALVTGGGRGIGRAICLMLAENWARVAINCQNNSEAAQETLTLVEGQGAEEMVVEADISVDTPQLTS